jgi:quinol monooxygenase YgiN
MHVAYPTSDGFYVGEVWESQDQHDAWFNEHVKPNLPAPDAMSTEYVQLHAVVLP